jgi:acetyltransferase-like isoleucine patch superfamily enzyme
MFFLPSSLITPLLRLLGYKVGKKLRIGFSIISVKKLELGDGVKIGHLNLIINDEIILGNLSSVGYMNILKGPFSLILKNKASIGNKNYFTRGRKGISYGVSELVINYNSKVTVGHHLDLTKSIYFGENSILAGLGSQMWTHGYYHADKGPERIRIDGEIKIGDNVYIGSSCIFNPGVVVSNSIHLGGGSVISKSLVKPGMYVTQGLRFIDNNIESIKNKLESVKEDNLMDNVYLKKNE